MKIKKLLLILFCCGLCFGAATTHDPWDGTLWDVTSPNDEALVGNTYKEIYDLRKGVAIRSNKEHETLATASAGGVHKQGSARAFFQDAAPTTQIDGTAWDAGDTGSLWFDTNATPDNLLYVLTNHASTGTWTLISTSLIAEMVAAVHAWADVQTFDVQTVHTLGILSNGDVTLGAGDDLVGSATSDILINTNKFTVAGASGNTLVGGTFDIQGTTAVVGVLDEDAMGTDSATNLATQQSIKAYVDAQVATQSFGALTTVDSESNTFLKNHSYQAQQDGLVTVYVTDFSIATAILKGWVSTGANPATSPDATTNLIQSMLNASASGNTGTQSITFAVASDSYWEVAATGTPVIKWQPFQTTGTAPVDQD